MGLFRRNEKLLTKEQRQHLMSLINLRNGVQAEIDRYVDDHLRVVHRAPKEEWSLEDLEGFVRK